MLTDLIIPERMTPDFSLSFNSLLKKISSTDKKFDLLLAIIRREPANNFFISGGAARDILLNNDNKIKDLDIFLSAGGYQAIADHLSANGRLVTNQFGTQRWFPDSTDELYYDIIQIPRFYNGLWACRNINDVLNQFDITVNAVAFDLADGTFHNPQNGYHDIENGILRAVRFDYPELPVSAEIDIPRNSVLWFRLSYYAKKLQLQTEPITLKWINDNAFRANDLEKFKTFFFDPKLPL